MTAAFPGGAVLPQWLVDAVMGLVNTAYQAGLAEGSATAQPAQPSTDLTLAEVRAELRISKTAVSGLVTSGELPSFRVGTRRFVRRIDLNEFRAKTDREAS